MFATQRMTSVEALLDAFHLAAATSDLGAWCGCFQNGSSRFLGTDRGENWSAQEAHDEFAPHFRSNKCAWRYVPIGTRKVVLLSSTMAVFDESLISESFICTCRGTGTLLSIDGCWFIAQYHLSFNVPNEIAKETCRKIADFEVMSTADKVLDELCAEEDAATAGKSKSGKKERKGKK